MGRFYHWNVLLNFRTIILGILFETFIDAQMAPLNTERTLLLHRTNIGQRQETYAFQMVTYPSSSRGLMDTSSLMQWMQFSWIERKHFFATSSSAVGVNPPWREIIGARCFSICVLSSFTDQHMDVSRGAESINVRRKNLSTLVMIMWLTNYRPHGVGI